MNPHQLLVAVTVASLAGCAGSVAWDHCEPAMCGVDAVDDPVSHVPVIPTLVMAPGGTTTIIAVLDVQGSYEDTYSFSASVDAPELTAAASPESSEVLDGVPFRVTVDLALDGAVVAPWTTVVSLQAAAASDPSQAAITSIDVEVP